MTETSRTSDITVNGTVITWRTISAEAQNHQSPGGQWSSAWRSAARASVIRELLLQKARALKLSPSPQEIAEGKLETDDEALIRQVLEEMVEPAPVEQDELRATYDKSPERFLSPPLWEASHILLAAAPDNAVARAHARAEARAVLEELKTAPKRFANLASQHSACQSRNSGGHLGQIGPGDTEPKFEAALRSLKPGEMREEPVETRFGFHIIRLEAAAPRQLLPFEAVLPRLREAAEKAAWIKASHAFATRLIAEAKIEGINLETGSVAA